jgi:hypothetical protein
MLWLWKVLRRGIKTMDFAGTKEIVYERSDWPLEKLQEYFKNDILCILGYGSQGHGQGLNARDNGLNVIIGVRKDGASWKKAQEEGWVCTQPLGVCFLREVDVPVRFLATLSSPSRTL